MLICKHFNSLDDQGRDLNVVDQGSGSVIPLINTTRKCP